MARLPVYFLGHGSPMLALEDSEATRGLQQIGKEIITKYGKPKAVLMISAHWYEHGTFIQHEEHPKQIYDMYGFPEELYQVKYPVTGCTELSERVKNLLGADVEENNKWGIDHGTWTTLIHVFPDADIPVVQLSVNRDISEQECYEIGKKLAPLREEGYLIMANGNVVHNLRLADWNNPGGTKKTVDFNENIKTLVTTNKIQELINYKNQKDWEYAIPTPDHYLPLLYVLGAADGDPAEVINDICNLGTMAMTCFKFDTKSIDNKS